MVNPSVPANNVKELIELAKKQPGKIHFASAGRRLDGPSVGRTVQGHGQDRDHPRSLSRRRPGDERPGRRPHPDDVRPAAGQPARRSAPARCARWRTPARSAPPALPDLPTVAEQGLPGFDASSWVALVAPAKTPAPVLAKLRAEVAKVMASPDIVKRFADLGSEPGTAVEKDVARSWMPRPRSGPR